MTAKTRTIISGILTTLAVVVPLAAYLLGFHHGTQAERREWLATEQTVTLLPASVAPDERAVQRPGNSTVRTFYTYPHSRQTFIAGFGAPPVNVPDPRDTPTK